MEAAGRYGYGGLVSKLAEPGGLDSYDRPRAIPRRTLAPPKPPITLGRHGRELDDALEDSLEDKPLRAGSLVSRHLTKIEREAPKCYIPDEDLANAIVHVGHMPFFAPDWAWGITIGNDIYIRDSDFSARTPSDIALLGHELVHVGQFRNGLTVFGYVWSCRWGYANSPYEVQARDVQDQILRGL
jgi:hypothetical protein